MPLPSQRPNHVSEGYERRQKLVPRLLLTVPRNLREGTRMRVRFWILRFAVASCGFMSAMVMAFCAAGYLAFKFAFEHIARLHKWFEDMP